MAFFDVKKNILSLLILTILASQAGACFGPKLFIGTGPGLTGEMRYHLVSIYLHEKTGIDSIQVVLEDGETAISKIQSRDIDLGFSADVDGLLPQVLNLPDGARLYSGTRPLEDLQFTTVPRVFKKLQSKIDSADLESLEKDVANGELPATAVRNFLLQNGWI